MNEVSWQKQACCGNMKATHLASRNLACSVGMLWTISTGTVVHQQSTQYDAQTTHKKKNNLPPTALTVHKVGAKLHSLRIIASHTSINQGLPVHITWSTIIYFQEALLGIAALVSKLVGGELVVFEILSQLQLVNFACSCVWNLLHKHHIFRYPPFGNLALQPAQNVLVTSRLVVTETANMLPCGRICSAEKEYTALNLQLA